MFIPPSVNTRRVSPTPPDPDRASSPVRLDHENGILLSPNFDALFDRHLVSFTDEGHLVRSSRVTVDDLIKMGINSDVVIPISDGMKKYLDHHRERVVDALSNGHRT